MQSLYGQRQGRASNASVQSVVNEDIAINAKYLLANIARIDVFIGGRGEHLLAGVAKFHLILEGMLLKVVDRKEMMVGTSKMRSGDKS